MAMSSNRLESVQKADEAHRQNIQKSVEHRLEVAKAKGDDKLIRQLEAEQAYYS
jgi:LPS O-antigen subunit length determinant protein (WzzB/FepE family)